MYNNNGGTSSKELPDFPFDDKIGPGVEVQSLKSGWRGEEAGQSVISLYRL